MVAFGTAMGALFAVAYALVRWAGSATSRPTPWPCCLAGAGFLGIYLVPFIKYPANPPSIGHPETIQARGGYYLLMVLASVVLLIAAVWLGQRLKQRFGTWNAALLAGAAFVVAAGIVMALLPQPGHLAFNEQTYGSHGAETPLPLSQREGNDRLSRVPRGRAVQLPAVLRRRAAPAVVGDRADLCPPRRPAAGSRACQRRTAYPRASRSVTR